MTSDSPSAAAEPLQIPGAGRLSQRAAATLVTCLNAAAVACLLGIIGVIALGVVSRYGFNASLTWTDEAARHLFIYLIFLALPGNLLRDDQLALTALIDRFGSGFRRRVAIFNDAVIAFVLFMMLFSGVTLVRVISGTTAALHLPNSLIYAAMPLAGLLGLLTVILGGFALGRPWPRVIGPVVLGLAAFGIVDTLDLVQLRGVSPSLAMALTFLILMVLGMPIALAMLASAFLAVLGADILPAPAVLQNMVSGAGKYLLLAIPFFLLTGTILNSSGLSHRLYDFSRTLVGHLRGGLAQINVLSSLMFGGISGSSTADAALDSKVLVPQMVRNGYRPEFSCAITAASAILPNIVPPSIAILIYAALADQSVARLFIAAVVPGLLLAALLMIAVHGLALLRGYGRAGNRASAGERLRAGGRAMPVLFVIIIVLVGIRFGIVTPTEAGVVAVLWCFLLWATLGQAFTPRDVYAAFATCASEAAMIGLLIGVAAPFAYVLIAERVPQTVVALAIDGSTSPWLALMLMNAAMLIAGTVLNVSAAMLILIPLFLPVVLSLGIDPIHFGIVVVVNLMLGGITPPVGILVYITSTISKTPVHLVFRAVMPLFLVLLAGLVVVTYVPAVSLGLMWWAF